MVQNTEFKNLQKISTKYTRNYLSSNITKPRTQSPEKMRMSISDLNTVADYLLPFEVLENADSNQGLNHF